MSTEQWNAIAKGYARLREPLTLPYGLDTLAAIRIAPGERLLDVACGTGAVALAAARQGTEVLAVDWSPGMVDFLSARAFEERVENLTARVMDGQNLELPTSHFDAACSVFGIMFFPDYRAGLSELLRVLKPGGRVGLAVWGTPSRMEHLAIWERAVHTIQTQAPNFPRPNAWVQLDSQEKLHQEMQRAGFRDVSVTPVVHEWEVPSPQWFIENADSSQSISEHFGLDCPDQLLQVIQRQLRQKYGDRPFTLTAHAHIGIATK
ncbi:class I SAM-dependent methyltransferase [Thalassoroseus pseudoceratinae]|uniref:class I SAM-dependent methyltransferase n=1 Tax=Thalassoroseus pseudoceratinae TaxID=2713176 RepID=UPI00142489B9|nr:class I SAM-dependent methyltransferase [Thalassoroseus pseudoceratinae]